MRFVTYWWRSSWKTPFTLWHWAFDTLGYELLKTSNDIFSLTLKEIDTIAEVKDTIHEKEEFLPNQQLLTYNGKELEDGCRLYTFCVGNSATLKLIISFQISVTIVDDHIITRVPQGVRVKLAAEVQLPSSYAVKNGSIVLKVVLQTNKSNPITFKRT